MPDTQKVYDAAGALTAAAHEFAKAFEDAGLTDEEAFAAPMFERGREQHVGGRLFLAAIRYRREMSS
jgi:hypothetical protein